MRRFPALVALLGLCMTTAPPLAAPFANAQSDLDAFMQKAIARRDDNWKKLQQYVLEERELIELLGPDRQPVWGERREYMWYIRNGFFVRSPLKFNGLTIGEADRRKYETEFLHREEARERRLANGRTADPAAPAPADDEASPDVSGVIRQAHQPGFVSSAYFLRFKFEEGKYALVGHETLESRDALRVEYYPARLFSREQDRERRRRQAGQSDPTKARVAEMERMLNKVSLVTLWIDPSSYQILKYTFANVDFDFMPVPWLVRVDDLHASMTMGQPFPDIWLPRDLDVTAAVTLAAGQVALRYGLAYHDYRLAEVNSKVRVPGAR